MPSDDTEPTVGRHEAEMERMLSEIGEKNEAVRQRDECEYCGDKVPDREFATKFMQAGGVLHGPFCSYQCHYAELMI